MRPFLRSLSSLLVLALLLCPTAMAEENTVYFYPDGGRYYHVRPDCPGVAPAWQALMQPLDAALLPQEPYSDLTRCALCYYGSRPGSLPGNPYRMSYLSAYDTAPEGLLLTEPGEYQAGIHLPAGVYTVQVQADIATSYFDKGRRLTLLAPDGALLHSYTLRDGSLYSFYLGDGMTVALPEGCTLQKVVYSVSDTFQSPEPVDVDSRRYFVMIECPGLRYQITAQAGQVGTVTLSTLPCELGQEAPQVITLQPGETTTLDLSGQYDCFLEVVDCIVQPVLGGAG